MTINQKLRGWLREQPLFFVLAGRNPLKGADKERTLTLIVVPILAFVLVVTGGVGAGFAAVSEPKPTQPVLSQASDVPEQSSSETPAPEEFAAEEPAAIDPYDEALETWGEPDLAAILSESFPDAEWSLNGNTYAGLNWFGPGPKPTEAQLRTLWITVGKVLADRRIAAEEQRAQEQADQEAAQQARAADPSRQELCRSIDYKALYGPGVAYDKVLSAHYPGTLWSITNNDYNRLTWNSPGAKPTKATLDGLWDGVAFQLCLQKPMSELQARAGTSETEEYVDGVLRPRGFSDGTFTPTLANCNTLPGLPSNGVAVGSLEIVGSIEMDMTELSCRIAQAHDWFGGPFSVMTGTSCGGSRGPGCIFQWYSPEVNPDTVRSVLTSIGVMAPEPEPEPEPESESESDE